jgi:lysyl-tRNA synthetase class 2
LIDCIPVFFLPSLARDTASASAPATGIDATHNPEFSTCELYWAYADCATLIPFTEELLRQMVSDLFGSAQLRLPWTPPSLPSSSLSSAPAPKPETPADASSSSAASPAAAPAEAATMIDFATPFARIDIVPALCAVLGVERAALPLAGLNRNDAAAIDAVLAMAAHAGVPPSALPSAPVTAARLLDKLIGHFIEPRCVQVR